MLYNSADIISARLPHLGAKLMRRESPQERSYVAISTGGGHSQTHFTFYVDEVTGIPEMPTVTMPVWAAEAFKVACEGCM